MTKDLSPVVLLIHLKNLVTLTKTPGRLLKSKEKVKEFIQIEKVIQVIEFKQLEEAIQVTEFKQVEEVLNILY